MVQRKQPRLQCKCLAEEEYGVNLHTWSNLQDNTKEKNNNVLL